MLKMDLALITYKGWCAKKPNQTKPQWGRLLLLFFFLLLLFPLIIIIIIIILLLERFFTSALDWWWFSLKSEWQQLSRTLLSILADLNNVVVWMVSTHPLISKSSSPFNNPSVTVPRAPIIFMFHSFFQFPSKVEVFILVFHLQFFFVVSRDSKVHNFSRSLLLFLLIRVFHITGDWVTASLLKSPGLFSVFWPFSIMLLFGWSSLGRQLLNLPGPLIIL